MRIELTHEQKRAAATDEQLVYIEAAPGSGKTTVAAERFGVVRYGGSANGRGVLGLSFARSARGELHRRVERRWGSDALRWPHKVSTLDAFHEALVCHLLRTGEIRWPKGHTRLRVLDTWKGQPGSRALTPGSGWMRFAAVTDDRRVVSAAARVPAGYTHGYGNKASYEAMLDAGICTHEEIRQVLRSFLGREHWRPAVADYLKASAKAVIVDEVFDGNRLDLMIVNLAVDARISATLIGDPWQALYEFRGAQPELVPMVIKGLGFKTFPVNESFRFKTEQMKDLASRLRRGGGVLLNHGSPAEVDVVLGSAWWPLWGVSDDVLPLSFGQIGNRTDAAIALLLDRLVSTHFGHLSTFTPDAASVLGLDPEIIRTATVEPFAPVLDELSRHDADGELALRLLRKALLDLGSHNLRKLETKAEAVRIERLRSLGRRLGKPRLTPAMTIHQAKGREWERVAVHLSAHERGQLAGGLSQELAGDRATYVALTRAKSSVVLV